MWRSPLRRRYVSCAGQMARWRGQKRATSSLVARPAGDGAAAVLHGDGRVCGEVGRDWPAFSLVTTKRSPSRTQNTGVVRARPDRRPVVVITGPSSGPATDSLPRLAR